MCYNTLFERYVNSKDNQTRTSKDYIRLLFERYVNSKDNQTPGLKYRSRKWFERYVNSKDNQTAARGLAAEDRLRDM